MKRREFMSLLGSAAACPLAARAQQAGKLSTIGFLGAGTRTERPIPTPRLEQVADGHQRVQDRGHRP